MADQVSPEKLDAMLRKVRALMATADHPNTPPHEADTAREMAEKLMHNYRIDEEMVRLESKVGTELKPGWQKIDVCTTVSEFKGYYRTIFATVLDHVGIRGVISTERREAYNEDGTLKGVYYVLVSDVCGYSSDLAIAELLYASAQVAFQSRVEPKYNPELSDQVNAYLMRSAGMEGWRIAQAIYGKDDRALRPKVRAMFKKEAMLRGEDPTPLLGKGNSMKDYRESYAKGFEMTIWQRLTRMRAARGDNSRGLVLKSRGERILEEYYAKYPQLRPKTPVRYEGTAWEDPTKDCPKCQNAKSGYCRDHSYLKPKAARLTPDRTNYAAYDRGANAAREVELGYTEQKLDSHNLKEIG